MIISPEYRLKIAKTTDDFPNPFDQVEYSRFSRVKSAATPMLD